ncbi:MAG: hypothetical protein DRO09_00940 [Thermoprotei archaeon]|nr:MAG: hypothetical protein DRO09_00940 [Thermoprotei archaeon]
MVAIDYSRSFKYIGLVAAREHVIKRSSFLNRASWVKHVADLPRREKLVYLRRFPSRLARVLEYLVHVKWFNSVEACNTFIKTLNPAIVVVDPKLHLHIDYPRRILEDEVKKRYEKILALLADNIAYYSYWALEVREKLEELRRILK